MEKINVLINDVEKEVYGLLYVYNLKYYFIYTEKELDDSGYVILYMTQVGKETVNTPNGPIDTGYMLAIEISDQQEQQNIQASISYIVEDKKNNTINPQIHYLPLNNLSKLKIISKKRFRLLKSIMENNFKLSFDDSSAVSNEVLSNQVIPLQELEPSIDSVVQPTIALEPQKNVSEETNSNDKIIIDYRSKFFEEQEKNKELQDHINLLTEKINNIKNLIE